MPFRLITAAAVVTLSWSTAAYAQQEKRSTDALHTGAMLGTFVSGRGAHPAAALRFGGHSRRVHADVIGMINAGDELTWEIAAGAGVNLPYRRSEILPGIRAGVWSPNGAYLGAAIGPHLAIATEPTGRIGLRAEAGSRLRLASGELAGGYYMLAGVEARLRNRRGSDR